jgi:hypothetical protein
MTSTHDPNLLPADLSVPEDVIAKAFYPVFLPDESAAEAVGWLRCSR